MVDHDSNNNTAPVEVVTGSYIDTVIAYGKDDCGIHAFPLWDSYSSEASGRTPGASIAYLGPVECGNRNASSAADGSFFRRSLAPYREDSTTGFS